MGKTTGAGFRTSMTRACVLERSPFRLFVNKNQHENHFGGRPVHFTHPHPPTRPSKKCVLFCLVGGKQRDPKKPKTQKGELILGKLNGGFTRDSYPKQKLG